MLAHIQEEILAPTTKGDRFPKVVVAALVLLLSIFAGSAAAGTTAGTPIAKNPSFIITNNLVWDTSTPGTYAAKGKEDTFAWSELTFEGDFIVRVTIASNAEKGEGVLIFGDGSGWSKGCLIFNIADDFQSIRGNSIYNPDLQWLARSNNPMPFRDRTYQMTIEVRGDIASISVDGKKLLSAVIPSNYPRKGRIGLFKHWSRPEVTYSNLSVEGGQAGSAVAAPRIESGRRVALLIGNADYRDAPLRNPVTDANDLAKVLQLLGFGVTVKSNANQQEMEEAVREFSERIKGSDVALFYFSGHGAEVKGVNYLMPSSEQIRSETDIRYKAVNAGYILSMMEESGSKTNIIILDACRNNPFKGVRSAGGGLVPMNAPVGSFIAYATAPGTVAFDGTERNGIYTKHLLESVQVKGLPIEETFKRVLVGVEKETNGQQVPWTSSSLRSHFFFVPQSR